MATKKKTTPKHQRVLKKIHAFGPVVNFGYTNEDDGLNYGVLTMDMSVFKELGSPEQVTVTVEPGDLLNA